MTIRSHDCSTNGPGGRSDLAGVNKLRSRGAMILVLIAAGGPFVDRGDSKSG